MSKLHKSASGNWNTCTAFKKPCPLGGAHITEQAHRAASTSLANSGFDYEYINTMTVEEVESVAADEQMEIADPEYKAAPLEDMTLRLPNLTGEGRELNFGRHQRTLDRVDRHDFGSATPQDVKDVEEICKEIQQAAQDSLKFIRAQRAEHLSKMKLNAMAMVKKLTKEELVALKMKPFTEEQIADWGPKEHNRQKALRKKAINKKVKDMWGIELAYHNARSKLKATYLTLINAIHVVEDVTAKKVANAEKAARAAQQAASDKEREIAAQKYSNEYKKYSIPL